MDDATSSGADPAVSVRLLWRHHLTEPARRGPRRGLTVDMIVGAAIALADEGGLTALTMRRLAQRLGVRPMSLYTYVPGRAELLDLMLDDAYARMPRPPHDSEGPWQSNVRSVAALNRDLHEQHPWTAELSTLRPPLGPGQLAKYDYELAAFAGSGLDDVTVDSALTYLLGFVRSSALDSRSAQTAVQREGQSDQEWWDRAGPVLAEVVDARRYPLAARVGAAAGKANASAHDPRQAYHFGLDRTIRAIELLSG